MDKKLVKKLSKQFHKASDKLSLATTATEWLDNGGMPDQDIFDGMGKSALHFIFLSNDSEIIERSLELLTPWDDQKAFRSMRDCVLAGNADALQRLFDLGVSPSHGTQPLSHLAVAADKKAFECADVLLRNGVPIDDRAEFGTPLHWAVMKNNPDAVRYLLANGADASAKTDGDESRGAETAMEIAVRRDHRQAVAALSHNADAIPAGSTEATAGSIAPAVDAQGTTPPAAGDAPAASRVDWPNVLAFHLPIALIGIPFLLPFIIALMGKIGIGGELFDLDYSGMLILSVTALGPSMYAYGTDLQFSTGRFLAAVAILVFATIKVMAGGGIVNTLPISFGGGLLGIGIATGLGYGGLAIRDWVSTPKCRRYGLWLGAFSILIVALIIGYTVIEENRRQVLANAKYEAVQLLRGEYWNELATVVASRDNALPQSADYLWVNRPQDYAHFQLGDDIELRVNQAYNPSGVCASLITGNIRKGPDEFFAVLERNKSRIESDLGYLLSWTKPKVQKTASGTRVSYNGRLGVCLADSRIENQSDWVRQHSWLAEKLSHFLSLTAQYHPDFENLKWRSAKG